MNNEYVAVKQQTLRDLIGFITTLYDCIDFDSKEVKEHGIENGWDDFVQPICDIRNGENNDNAQRILAKDVDIKIFKETLEEVYEYDITGLTDKQITELYNDVQERLSADDTYNDIYNKAVYDAFKEFEKNFASLDAKIQCADEIKEKQDIDYVGKQIDKQVDL